MSAQKKPRLSSDAPAQLVDLPDSVLAEAATYLTPTSCVLFAVAISSSQSSWLASNWQHPPSSASRAITDGHWGVGAGLLDEIDVGKVLWRLRGELSDADIGGMLVCMDAKNTLKSLKLTHCFGITGVCLEPLRGSSVLRRIDLSLVGMHESPEIDEMALSEEAILPILNSIIRKNDSSLRHIQLPKSWREGQSEEMSNFLRRYGEHLDSHQLTCMHKTYNRTTHSRTNICGKLVRGTEDTPWILSGATMGGIQCKICYKCLNSFCDDCGLDALSNCHGCQKMLCEDCVPISFCETDSCVGGEQKASCYQCELVMTCSGCESSHCSDCSPMERCPICGCVVCVEFCLSTCEVEGCNNVSCLGCSEEEIGKAVRYCSNCDAQVCFDCRVQKCRQEGDHISCAECMRIIGPTLLSEYGTMRQVVKPQTI